MAITALILASCLAAQAVNPEDQRILAMGHEKWIAYATAPYPDDPNAVFNAEGSFAAALGRRNERLIEASPERERAQEVQMWIANLTKGATRISDYVIVGTPHERVYSARAHVSANLALARFLGDRSVPTPAAPTRQSDLWKLYREVETYHRAHESKIHIFASEHGGYSVKQLGLEYQALGAFMARAMRAIAKSPADRRAAIIAHCYRMVALTRGDDPLAGIFIEVPSGRP